MERHSELIRRQSYTLSQEEFVEAVREYLIDEHSIYLPEKTNWRFDGDKLTITATAEYSEPERD